MLAPTQSASLAFKQQRDQMNASELQPQLCSTGPSEHRLQAALVAQRQFDEEVFEALSKALVAGDPTAIELLEDIGRDHITAASSGSASP